MTKLNILLQRCGLTLGSVSLVSLFKFSQCDVNKTLRLLFWCIFMVFTYLFLSLNVIKYCCVLIDCYGPETAAGFCQISQVSTKYRIVGNCDNSLHLKLVILV